MNSISMMVAKGENNVIGKDNKLIWNIPNDLEYFKQVTTGNTIVMGRKTYESIGRPLPDRTNVVLTTNKDFQDDRVTIVHSVDEVLHMETDGDIIIIGGDSIYKQFIDHADTLFVTEIKEYFDGDTYFPEVDKDLWKIINSIKGEKDDKNSYDYYFNIYKRIDFWYYNSD